MTIRLRSDTVAWASVLVLALVIIAAVIGLDAIRSLRRLPHEARLPIGDCRNPVTARVEQQQLHLGGFAEADTARALRDASSDIWWVDRVVDEIAVAPCGECRPDRLPDPDHLRVRFDTALDTLAPGSLDGAIDLLTRCPNVTVRVDAWADDRWVRHSDPPPLIDDFGEPYNSLLSQKRADAVKTALAAAVGSSRVLSAEGHGATRHRSPVGLPDRSAGDLDPNRAALLTYQAESVAPQFHYLAAPGWFVRMFWWYWTLAAIAGSALALAVMASVRALTRLRPDTNAPPDENRLEIIEGIGPFYAKRIEMELGVRTIAGLAALDGPGIARIAALAPTEGVGGAQLPAVGIDNANAWVAMARLIQLPTVTKDWAELLVAAGVTSVGDLARQSASTLRRRVVVANSLGAEMHEGRRAACVPSEQELGYIISLANDEVRARAARDQAARKAWLGRLVEKLRRQPSTSSAGAEPAADS